MNEHNTNIPDKEGYVSILDFNTFKVKWLVLFNNIITCYESKEASIPIYFSGYILTYF